MAASHRGHAGRSGQGPGDRVLLRRPRFGPARSDTGREGRLRRHEAKGSLFVDHTTASASIARELAAEAQKRGFDFVDAPVSGGQAGAVNGKLGIMCGGTEAAYARAEPVMAVYTKLAKRLGPAGSGQLTKMATRSASPASVQGMAEAYSLMRAAGLDIEAVTEVISKGAAQSWQMENRYKTMSAGEYNHGFAVEWMRKDLGIAWTRRASRASACR